MADPGISSWGAGKLVRIFRQGGWLGEEAVHIFCVHRCAQI